MDPHQHRGAARRPGAGRAEARGQAGAGRGRSESILQLKIAHTPPIVLFDGVCNLCSGSVQFILKRDRRGEFRFASLQSPAGQSLLQRSGLPTAALDSFVFLDNDKVYTRSSGALRVLKKLGFPWSLLYVFWIIPRPLRDKVYDWIARNRYRWFGKKEACWLPRPEWKERFLD